MKNVKFLLSTLVVFVTFNGCASHQNFINQQNAWNGQNISSYIDSTGYPESSYDLPNGNKVYVYIKRDNYGYYTDFSMGFDGTIGRRGYIGFPIGFGSNYNRGEVITCQLFIETDKSGKIIKWSSRGNSCIARDNKN